MLRNAVFWNISLRTFFEGYLPVTFSLFSQVKSGFSWSSPVVIGMDLIQVLMLLLVILLPLLLFRFLRRNSHLFRTPRIKSRFGDTVSILKHRTKSSAFYVLFFCLNRLLFVLIIVFADKAWI